MKNNEKLVEVIDLYKEYFNYKSEVLSFSIYSGDILGFIGENGSGKTTIIKQIVNLIKIDSGIIKVLGINIDKMPKEKYKDIGVVLDESYLPNYLNIKQIDYMMKGIFINWNHKYFYELISKFELPDNKTIKKLSKGMKMQLNIAVALAHEPKLLILDEPTSGLSDNNRRIILNIISEYVNKTNCGVLFTSHIQDDFDKIATKTIYIKKI